MIYILLMLSMFSSTFGVNIDPADIDFMKHNIEKISVADAYELEEICKDRRHEERALDVRILLYWLSNKMGDDLLWEKIEEFTGSRISSRTAFHDFLSGKDIFGFFMHFYTFYLHGGESLVMPSGLKSLKYYFCEVVDKKHDSDIKVLEKRLRSPNNAQVAHDVRSLLCLLCKEYNVKQEWISIKFDVSQSTVSKFLRKKAFGFKLIDHVRNYYMANGESLVPYKTETIRTAADTDIFSKKTD